MSINPAATLTWKKSTRHSLPRVMLSKTASRARKTIAARRLRASGEPAAAEGSGSCIQSKENARQRRVRRKDGLNRIDEKDQPEQRAEQAPPPRETGDPAPS